MNYWESMEEIRNRQKRKENQKSVHEKLIKEKPKLEKDDNLYTFDELKETLLDYRGLKEVVTGFKPTEKEMKEDALLITTVTNSRSEKNRNS